MPGTYDLISTHADSSFICRRFLRSSGVGIRRGLRHLIGQHSTPPWFGFVQRDNESPPQQESSGPGGSQSNRSGKIKNFIPHARNWRDHLLCHGVNWVTSVARFLFFFVPSEKQRVTITTSDLACWFWPATKIILELQSMIVPYRFDLLSEKLSAFYKLEKKKKKIMNFYSQITTLIVWANRRSWEVVPNCFIN